MFSVKNTQEKYICTYKPTVWQVAQSPPRPITEVKQHWARSVLGSVTAFFFSATTSCDRLGVEFAFLQTEREVWINTVSVSKPTECDLDT